MASSKTRSSKKRRKDTHHDAQYPSKSVLCSDLQRQRCAGGRRSFVLVFRRPDQPDVCRLRHERIVDLDCTELATAQGNKDMIQLNNPVARKRRKK